MSEAAAGGMANLLARLDDARFEQMAVHHAIEDFERRGVLIERFPQTPESVLAWIDAEFRGTWSSEAALGGAYVARDAGGPLGFAAFDARGLRFRWLEPFMGRKDVGIFGPFGVAPRARTLSLGSVLLTGALFSLRERGYAEAVIPAVNGERLIRYYHAHAGARVANRFELDRLGPQPRTVILASGTGSNAVSVFERVKRGDLRIDLAGVVCNKTGAAVLERAAEAGVPATLVTWNKPHETRAEFDARVVDAVAAYAPDLVLLLGWMHVLPAEFVTRFPQTLNLHPAFLPIAPESDHVTMPDGSAAPVLRGARSIDEALALGLRWSGASVHRLRLEVDRGEIFARAPLRRVDGEPDSAFVERLHALERTVVAAAVRRWTFEFPAA